MGLQPRILAISGSPATQQGVESGVSFYQKCDVRCFNFIFGILTDSTVVFRQTPPFLFQRQSPSISQRQTCSPRCLPGVQTAILKTVRLRIFVAVGRNSFDVQIACRPLLAIRHPRGGVRCRGRFAVLRCKYAEEVITNPVSTPSEIDMEPSRICLLLR